MKEKIEHEILPWEKKYGFIGLRRLTTSQIEKFFPDKEKKYWKINAFGFKVEGRLELRYNRLYITQEVMKNLEVGKKVYLVLEEDNKIYLMKEILTEKSLEYAKKDTEMNHITSEKYINILEENKILLQRNRELELENRDFEEQLRKYEILEKFFDSEEELEEWVLKKVYKLLPGLTVLDNQIYMKWKDGKFNRSDIFCLNQRGELVIIENKTRKRDLKSAEPQVMYYTTWAKKNEEKLLSEYKDKGLKDIKNLKFVIITDHYDDRLKSICEEFNISLLCIEGGFNIEVVVPLE